MKTILMATSLILLGVASLSCTDQDKIAAAIQDGNEVKDGDHLPIQLSQNYPNPFNPSTDIRFAVSFQMHVKLQVLTEDWQVVSTLIDEPLVSGIYFTEFNARELPSGEYYYTLEGSGVTIVHRMRVLK